MAVRKKMTSLASQFSRQLYELIAKIRSTRSHFVRCIKPNNQLLANTFDYEMVMNQLRCGGALGAVQVFRAGFPNRMDFKFFTSRYSAFLVLCGVNALTKDLYECLIRARESGSDELWKLSASMLVDIVSMTVVILNMSEEAEISSDTNILSGLQMGKTQMFLRVPVFEILERLHVRSMNVIAKRLQRRVRSKLIMKTNGRSAKFVCSESLMYGAFRRRVIARKCISATLVLQRRVRVFLAQIMLRRAIRGLTKLKAVFRGYKARQRVKLIKFEAATTVQAAFRCYIATKKFHQMKMSCVRLQANARMVSAVSVRKTKLRLILNLQCMWRGTQARIRTWAIRQKLKQAQLVAQKRAAEAKADFMTNLDDKLKSNPNLLFDMMGASEKIAILTRQNELLMQSNKILEKENIDLRRSLNSMQHVDNLLAAAHVAPPISEASTVVSDTPQELISAVHNSDAISASKDIAVEHLPPTTSGLKKDSSAQGFENVATHPITPTNQQEVSKSVDTSPLSLFPENNPAKVADIADEKPKVRLLMCARECAGIIYKQLGAAKNRKSQLSSDLTSSQNDNTKLIKAIKNLTEKKAAATIKLEAIGSFLSEPKDDSSAQLLAVENQIQIMQKRKATLVKLLGTLQEDRSSFFEADINGAMEALNEIDVKLAELCAYQQKLSKAPIHFTDLTQPSEKGDVNKAVEEAQSLEASVSFISDEIKTVSQQQTLAELNVREIRLKHADAIEECNALEADLRVLQEIISRLDTTTAQRSSTHPFKTSTAPVASNADIITDKVKEKLSSVRGMMGRMSFGGFTSRIGNGSFLTPEKEEAVLSPSDKSEVISEHSLQVSGDLGSAEPTTTPKNKWNPDFIGSVGAWARSGKRDVVFILSVRAVESGAVAEWTVTKSFADFKALRQDLLAVSPGTEDFVCITILLILLIILILGIDSTFPSDSLYSMFTVSNETAELRKEGLNTYLLSICGCEEIMARLDLTYSFACCLRLFNLLRQSL